MLYNLKFLHKYLLSPSGKDNIYHWSSQVKLHTVVSIPKIVCKYLQFKYLPIKMQNFISKICQLSWVWASPQDSPVAGATPSTGAAASLSHSLTPRVPYLAATFVARVTGRGRGHSTKSGTAASLGTTSNGPARWLRKVVPQHDICSHIRYDDISDVHPLTQLKAVWYLKPKQRELGRFPLMVDCATLIHFLWTSCQ